ncbi:MAG: hypothetical protein A6F71_04455 [Cycloclasticus sp. symbiont of Poecilosclerida sp. M]|nr:MAG: hypothetical protein A6F71_04455 [Cycloclasticus sp. symbiont of Poecilosclerida sp. M]
MLNTAFNEINHGIENNTFSFAESPSLWFKTRRIINVAVPHNGGDPSLTRIGQSIYKYVYLLAKPFLKLIRTLTQGAADVGKNEIIDSLRHNNPWLRTLHTENESALAKSQELRLPYPASFDILAGSDVAVPTDTNGPRQVTFRGNHDTVKVPDNINGPIMDILVTQVMDYSGSNYYLVMHAYAITRKLDALNRELGTQILIGRSEPGAQNSSTQPTNSESQQRVFDLMYARLNSDKTFLINSYSPVMAARVNQLSCVNLSGACLLII